MKDVMIKIAEIYIPAAKRGPLDPEKVNALAESIAENGQQMPILVRPDKERYVLVSGLHRLGSIASDPVWSSSTFSNTSWPNGRSISARRWWRASPG
jgi:sulfiredoxin